MHHTRKILHICQTGSKNLSTTLTMRYDIRTHNDTKVVVVNYIFKYCQYYSVAIGLIGVHAFAKIGGDPLSHDGDDDSPAMSMSLTWQR
jgi:hypothetical protein